MGDAYWLPGATTDEDVGKARGDHREEAGLPTAGQATNAWWLRCAWVGKPYGVVQPSTGTPARHAAA